MKAASMVRRRQGFTLVELVIATAVSVVLGGVVFTVASAGTRLFSANVATNNAHQAARLTTSRIVQGLYGAISVPQLLDANLQAVTPVVAGGAVTPQVGVSFYEAQGSPCRLNGSVAKGGTVFRVNFAGSSSAPAAGDRMVIPTQNFDSVVTAAQASGSNRNITVIDPSPLAMDGSTNASNQIAVYFLRRAGYAAVGEELRYFPSLGVDNSSFEVVATGIANPAPFSHPVGQNGQPDTARVSVVLSTRDASNSFSNVTNSAAQMLLNTTIANRYSMTGAQ